MPANPCLSWIYSVSPISGKICLHYQASGFLPKTLRCVEIIDYYLFGILFGDMVCNSYPSVNLTGSGVRVLLGVHYEDKENQSAGCCPRTVPTSQR
jgi:hypothetical protein